MWYSVDTCTHRCVCVLWCCWFPSSLVAWFLRLPSLHALNIILYGCLMLLHCLVVYKCSEAWFSVSFRSYHLDGLVDVYLNLCVSCICKPGNEATRHVQWLLVIFLGSLRVWYVKLLLITPLFSRMVPYNNLEVNCFNWSIYLLTVHTTLQ